MSRFHAMVTEVTIYMDDDLLVTTISAPDKALAAKFDEVQIGDFHMTLFSAEEWNEISELIAKAIKSVTGDFK